MTKLHNRKLSAATTSSRYVAVASHLLIGAIVALTGSGMAGTFLVFANDVRLAIGCAACGGVFVILCAFCSILLLAESRKKAVRSGDAIQDM